MKVLELTQDRLVVTRFAWRFGLIMLLGGFAYATLNEQDGGARWQSIVAILLFAIPAWGMSYRAVITFDRTKGIITIDEHASVGIRQVLCGWKMLWRSSTLNGYGSGRRRGGSSSNYARGRMCR